MRENLDSALVKSTNLTAKVEGHLAGTLSADIRLVLERALIKARELTALLRTFDSDEEMEANGEAICAKMDEVDKALDVDPVDMANFATRKIQQAVEGYIAQGLKPPATEQEFKDMMLTVMTEEQYNTIDKNLVANESVMNDLLKWALSNNVHNWTKNLRRVRFRDTEGAQFTAVIRIPEGSEN